jgi:cytidylate kinase
MTVITVSAPYGAGGSAIAPRVAERLGVPFVDRAIPAVVAGEVGLTVDEADALAHNVTGRWSQFLAAMAGLSFDFGLPTTDDGAVDEADLVAGTEEHLRHVAASGGVVLGHAAAVVLAGRPDALHVRLDGPAEDRVDAAIRQHGIDRDTAQGALRDNDKLRSGYVTHFYQVDASDPSLYDLVLDTTRLGWKQTEQIIVYTAGLGDRSVSRTRAP